MAVDIVGRLCAGRCQHSDIIAARIPIHVHGPHVVSTNSLGQPKDCSKMARFSRRHTWATTRDKSMVRPLVLMQHCHRSLDGLQSCRHYERDRFRYSSNCCATTCREQSSMTKPSCMRVISSILIRTHPRMGIVSSQSPRARYRSYIHLEYTVHGKGQ